MSYSHFLKKKLFPACIYCSKSTIGKFRERWEICSNLTDSDVNDVVLISLFLILNRFHTLVWCFRCWLWRGKWSQGWLKKVYIWKITWQNLKICCRKCWISRNARFWFWLVKFFVMFSRFSIKRISTCPKYTGKFWTNSTKINSQTLSNMLGFKNDGQQI